MIATLPTFSLDSYQPPEDTSNTALSVNGIRRGRGQIALISASCLSQQSLPRQLVERRGPAVVEKYILRPNEKRCRLSRERLPPTIVLTAGVGSFNLLIITERNLPEHIDPC